MLESVRRLVAFPRVDILPVASVAAVVAFVWLLLHDHVHPFVIYLAQIYLSF
jgi:hypothetical protein